MRPANPKQPLTLFVRRAVGPKTPVQVGTYAGRIHAVRVQHQSLERVQHQIEGGKVIQAALLQAHSQQLEAKRAETNPMSQFMALQAENIQSPEVELHRSYLVMMTMLQINFSRTGMIYTAVSNLAKARHDTQKNAIANLR